jgi:NADPH2:quinone reductase
LFELMLSGDVAVQIGARYPLAQAAEAHRALEARETTGSTVLIP